jgi:hypothetical protein
MFGVYGAKGGGCMFGLLRGRLLLVDLIVLTTSKEASGNMGLHSEVGRKEVSSPLMRGGGGGGWEIEGWPFGPRARGS